MSELFEQTPLARYRIVLLCGGPGSERAVSIASGNAVLEALLKVGATAELFTLEREELPAGLVPERDIVLPLIHGTFGEDGRLSALLDAGGFAYGGSDASSSEWAFDKLRSKACARDLGIPVASDISYKRGESIDFGHIESTIGYPFIVKPVCDGSSVGLKIFQSSADAERVPIVAESDILVESYYAGTDVTVALFGEAVLGSVSIHPRGGVYDYTHKYTAGLTRYATPAEVAPFVLEQLESAANRIFYTMGCRDLARVDFRVNPDGEWIFLEINTLPGMTSTSLFPMAAKRAGLSFETLLLRWSERVALRIGASA
jgi:D-alanine-D-alanine ligase